MAISRGWPRCFGNPINNAAKYTDPGGRLEADREAATPCSACATGMGIPAGALATVFEPFTQPSAR